MNKISNYQKDKVVLGVNIFKGVSVLSYDRILDFIKDETGNIRSNHMESLPPGYQNSRKLYRSFGIDPTRYRPSSEALWRRVKKGESLPEVNPFVDLTNLLSLNFQIPYGLYDLNKINGDVALTTGDNGDWYEGIRKERVSLQGRVVLSDRTGPFGNPSSDSLRTSTEIETRDILQVIFFTHEEEKREIILSSSEDLYRRYIKISETISYMA
ncbi:MAG: phenylalanine--tRNA ligase beta subunit-related protein [Acidobacteriota bacterium]